MEWWIWTLLWVQPLRTPPRPEVEQAFESRRVMVAGEQIDYRFFRPNDNRPQATLPLLVWLHGRGEAGDNNRDQLAWLELIVGRDPDQMAEHQFCILAAQCPARHATWLGGGPGADEPLGRIEFLLEETLRTERIDRRRIYLAGVSTGATGCWELARRRPHLFAAIVPFASTMANPHGVSSLVGTPVWAFQSSADGPAARHATERMITALRQAGGRAHLTIVDAPGHDCWTEGFRRYRAWSWLMSQRRGSYFCLPPGYPPPRLRTWTLTFSAVLGSLIACRLRRLWRSRRFPRGVLRRHYGPMRSPCWDSRRVDSRGRP